MASQGVSLTKQAYGLVDDLMTPNAAIYWIDTIVSVALMWGGLYVAVTTGSLAIGLVAGLVSVLADHSPGDGR